MPVYEYICEDCEQRFEDIRRFTDRKEPGPECGECRKPSVFVISATKRQNFKLKNVWKSRNTNFTEI